MARRRRPCYYSYSCFILLLQVHCGSPQQHTLSIPVTINGMVGRFDVRTDTFQFDGDEVPSQHQDQHQGLSLFDQAQEFCEFRLPADTAFDCADRLESAVKQHLRDTGRPVRLSSSDYARESASRRRGDADEASKDASLPLLPPRISAHRVPQLTAMKRELEAMQDTCTNHELRVVRRRLGEALVEGGVQAHPAAAAAAAAADGSLGPSSRTTLASDLLDLISQVHLMRMTPPQGGGEEEGGGEGGERRAAAPAYYAGIAFIHISRSAGSTLCDAAWRHGCGAPGQPNREDNCASKAIMQDGPKWFRVGNWATQQRHANVTNRAAGRAVIMRERRWSFLAIENYLEPQFFARGGSSQGLFTVTILRKPLDRIASHHRFLSRMLQRKEIVMDFRNGSGPMTLQGPPSVELFTTYAQVIAPYDNMATRVLNGGDCYWSGLGSVASRHLDVAKDALEQVDLVLTFEGLFDGRLAVALRGSLGWPLTEQPLNVVRKSQPSSAPGGQEQLFSDHELAFLKSMNRHDEELHRHAATLFTRDHAVFSAAQFHQQREEPSRTCGYLGRRRGR